MWFLAIFNRSFFALSRPSYENPPGDLKHQQKLWVTFISFVKEKGLFDFRMKVLRYSHQPNFNIPQYVKKIF